VQRFTDAMVHFCTGEVRSDATIALEKLMSHTVTQGNDPVATYAQRFNVVARMAAIDMTNAFTQASLCQHFLHGLVPALRARCATDEKGSEWYDLNNLIQYSFREERRKRAHDAALSEADYAPRRYPRAQATAAAAAAAALGAAAAMDVDQQAPARSFRNRTDFEALLAKEQPYTNAQVTWESASRPPENSAEYKAALPGNLRPLNDFPLSLGFSGTFARARTDKELSRKLELTRIWWVCTFCRKGRHCWADCNARKEASANEQQRGKADKRPSLGQGSGSKKKKR
jgi:hypothetical protein